MAASSVWPVMPLQDRERSGVQDSKPRPVASLNKAAFSCEWDYSARFQLYRIALHYLWFMQS